MVILFLGRNYLASLSALPSSVRRTGSSSRPLPRDSTIDYDRVPSPRPVSRHSSVQSGRNSRPLNPSKLQMEIRVDEGVSHGPIADSGADFFSPVGIGRDYEDVGYPDGDDAPDDESPSPSSRGNISFTALAQDDEDNMLEDDMSPVSSRADKGKGRAHTQDSGEEDTRMEDDRTEEDMASGLQDNEDATDDEDGSDPGPSKESRSNGRVSGSDSKSSNMPSKKTRPTRTNKKPRISTYGKFMLKLVSRVIFS